MDIESFLVSPPKASSPSPVSPPIHRSTTFAHRTTKDFATAAAMNSGPISSQFYSRVGNQTVEYVADRIAALEGADQALLFPSGMAALTTAILALSKVGDHIICQSEVYGHLKSFISEYLPRFGVSTTFVEFPTQDSVAAAIRDETVLILLESPSNPGVHLCDIAAISTIAQSHNILTLVDSTFATPYLQKPMEFGASIVAHSGSKYLSGHSDVICGVLATNSSLAKEIHRWQMRLGTVIDPQGAWLLDRGLRTLSVRMNQHCQNASAIAQYLTEHQEFVAEVFYPSLPGSKSESLAKLQMPNGCGGVVSFLLRHGIQAARDFVDAFQMVSIGTSLGSVESLIEIPSDIEYTCNNSEKSTAWTGSSEASAMVRFSVGIESVRDLIADVDRGLTAIRAANFTHN